jgi:hypothetical protein
MKCTDIIFHMFYAFEKCYEILFHFSITSYIWFLSFFNKYDIFSTMIAITHEWKNTSLKKFDKK